MSRTPIAPPSSPFELHRRDAIAAMRRRASGQGRTFVLDEQEIRRQWCAMATDKKDHYNQSANHDLNRWIQETKKQINDIEAKAERDKKANESTAKVFSGYIGQHQPAQGQVLNTAFNIFQPRGDGGANQQDPEEPMEVDP